METIVKLNVSARDLFAIMEQSLLQEVKAATNKNVDATQIGRGFTYTKKSQGRSVKVAVTGWKRDALYEATFTSNGDTIFVRYELEPEGENAVSVTYREEIRRKGQTKPTFASRLGEKKAIKQAKRMLMAVEATILNQKKAQDHSS
ncbi:DUF3284 domain-containing protein [Dubosiella muris]|uniref:DUF3284 domain-containing protein n=1 Tax=Dubosiella muris TaxID=3038133 RepID=A0AC61R4X6_9FIRM|nr:DUF3284 domain-containing protein [Dubosiella muris]TGY64966.1 DUF3284 domain-containing protein [Dubosiella muris]